MDTKCFVGINSDLPKLVDEIIAIFDDLRVSRSDKLESRYIYSSILPFLPPSSLVARYYGNLSDPIRLLRVHGGNYKPHVPCIMTTLRMRNKALEPAPITPIACAALSNDGRCVALGFCDGIVEVVDAELGAMISRFADGPPNPPVWLFFTDEDRKLVTENSEGDIYVLDNVTSRRVTFGSRLGCSTKVIASLSHNGSMVVRVAQHVGREWYENVNIISIEDSTINAFLPPSLDSSISAYDRFPFRRSLGFSPDGRYVAAFDTQDAFIWSSTSFHVVAQYSIGNPKSWFLNTNRPSTTLPFKLPAHIIFTPVFEPSQPITSLSCVLFTLTTSSNTPSTYTMPPRADAVSQAAVTVPHLSLHGHIWFKDHEILIIPTGYRDPISCSTEVLYTRDSLWLTPQDCLPDSTLPTSRDGTRFLVCDEGGFPVIIDISGVTSSVVTT